MPKRRPRSVPVDPSLSTSPARARPKPKLAPTSPEDAQQTTLPPPSRLLVSNFVDVVEILKSFIIIS